MAFDTNKHIHKDISFMWDRNHHPFDGGNASKDILVLAVSVPPFVFNLYWLTYNIPKPHAPRTVYRNTHLWFR